MSAVYFWGSELGIFILKFWKNQGFLPLGIVPFISITYRRKTIAVTSEWCGCTVNSRGMAFY
jgi:hypothetical protein